MNKTYEILPEGQVKIKEEVVTIQEKIVDISAVQKRIEEINKQITDLSNELTGWESLIISVENQNLDAVLPEDIGKVKEVK